MNKGYVVISCRGRVKKLTTDVNPTGCRAGVLFNNHENRSGTIFSTYGKARSAIKRTELYAAQIGQAENEFWMDNTIQKVKKDES